jgi:GT2 family glycosyltransferase
MTNPFPPVQPETSVSPQTGPTVIESKSLSILLVNYNCMSHLAPCLDSIHRFAPPGTQVVLEDNASTDGSVESAEKQYPWLQVIRSSRNLGFAGGNNLAGNHAQGRFILLLNTDTLLLQPIAPLIEWLETHSAYGALTVNMIDGDRVPRACTGRFPSASRLALLRLMLVSPRQYGSEMAYAVDWVQGSFVLMRADLWRALNGLDEKYFMYAEDIDLCKRVWDAGFKCAYLPKYQYLHWGGFSPSRFPDQVRGLATYVEKHMQGLERIICRSVLFGGCLIRAAVYGISGFLCRRKIDRIRAIASWRAFEALVDCRA